MGYFGRLGSLEFMMKFPITQLNIVRGIIESFNWLQNLNIKGMFCESYLEGSKVHKT